MNKPRFESEEEIIAKIDKVRAQAEYQQDLSAQLYESSKRYWALFYRHGKLVDKHTAEEVQDRAKAADVKASQLIQITLKKLGERLSEFRTQRMPFLEDSSIPQ